MSAWDRVLGVARDVAPTLAGAAATIATGGNPMAGAAVAALARRVVGAKADAPLEDVAEQLLGNPEAIQKFRVEMRQLELEELRLRTLDVQDARRILDRSAGPVVVSIIVVLGYFIATLLVMTNELPPGSENLAYLLLGNLGTGFGMVLTFWLGSSVGSKDKDQAMAKHADAAKRDQIERGQRG